MLRGLYTAYTGMLNEQYRMDIMSNNLANADTVGFKKEGSTSQAYSEVMAVKIKDTTEDPNTPKRLGNMSLGVKIGETYTDFSQGSLRDTGNTYDLALSGDGFFNIEFTNKAGETSTKYTRAGNFTLTKEGYLTTKDGDYVLGENGRIQLSTTAGNTVIMEDGSIYQDDVLVTKLKITEFEDTNYLTHYGESMWDAKEGAVANDAAVLFTESIQPVQESLGLAIQITADGLAQIVDEHLRDVIIACIQAADETTELVVVIQLIFLGVNKTDMIVDIISHVAVRLDANNVAGLVLGRSVDQFDELLGLAGTLHAHNQSDHSKSLLSFKIALWWNFATLTIT